MTPKTRIEVYSKSKGHEVPSIQNKIANQNINTGSGSLEGKFDMIRSNLTNKTTLE